MHLIEESLCILAARFVNENLKNIGKLSWNIKATSIHDIFIQNIFVRIKYLAGKTLKENKTSKENKNIGCRFLKLAMEHKSLKLWKHFSVSSIRSNRKHIANNLHLKWLSDDINCDLNLLNIENQAIIVAIQKINFRYN